MQKIKTVVSLIVLLALMSLAPVSVNSEEGTNKGDKLELSNSTDLQQVLQKYNESLVLINFWAAYDANSHVENIKLAFLTEKYKEKQFENANGLAMISLSMDEFRSVANEVAKRDNLPNNENLFVEKGFDSEIAKSYRLGKSFGNFLVDNKGVIIAKNISVEQLEEILLQL